MAAAEDQQLDPWGAFVDRVNEAPRGDGPLAGLRLAVKDNIAVSGLKWTAGLPLLADRVADGDAACVAALRRAGASIVGTAVTDAAGFGMTTPGVINPLAADRTVGGSSGGSAAAVAAGLADVALGTDTAGSVRVPAACCGLYGMKPTHGRVPVDGVTPLSLSFDHVGVIAAHLDVLERTLSILLPGMGIAGSEGSRIGFDPRRLEATSPLVRDAVELTLQWLAGLGHELVEVDLPDRVELADMQGAIVCAEALQVWGDHWPHNGGLFGDTARRSLSYAEKLPHDEVLAARARLPAIRARIGEAFHAADVILGPTIAVPPPPAGVRRVKFGGAEVPVVFALLAETCPFNISGHPALAAPLPWHDHGIPVSIQIASRHDREADAIAVARKLSEMTSSA